MRTETAEPASIAYAPLLLGVGLVSVLLVRLVALRFNATDLFFDEAQYWSWGKEPAFGYYSKPPLIAWIIGLTTKLCGDSTFCVRLPAPILHTATAVVLFTIGQRFLSTTAGLWAAIGFVTLPAVSLSSGIISTDVPLLLCWALALLAFLELLRGPRQRWWPAILLGAALGIGMNAKYAMVFFCGSAALYFVLTPSARWLLADKRLWAALLIGAAFIVPNMLWNHAHSFPTLAHTADNARWGGSLFNFGKGLEFVAAQAAVFGPILLVALVLLCKRSWSEGLPDIERLLLIFTLPVLIVISAQAFVSRAHANWAATAYVAGTLLVASALLRLGAAKWLKVSLGLHVAVAALLMAGTAAAGRFTLPGIGDPFQRTLGWKELAEETQRTLATARGEGRPFKAVFADDRSVTAELLYYMRDETTPVLAWRAGLRPLDHYELTRPYRDPAVTPVLLVSLRRDASEIISRFRDVTPLGERSIPAGKGEPRRVRFYALSGLKPR